MDHPLTVWYCDVCGEKIEGANQGYVIWDSQNNEKASQFKIVHQTKCDTGKENLSAALEDFRGDKGIAILLSFLSQGPVEKNFNRKPQRVSYNLDNYVDFFRRVQVPYYEEARLIFGNRDYLESLSDHEESYLPDRLVEIIRGFGSRT